MSATVRSTPLTGAATVTVPAAAVDTMPTPLPSVPPEKTLSSTSDRSTTCPSTGASTRVVGASRTAVAVPAALAEVAAPAVGAAGVTGSGWAAGTAVAPDSAASMTRSSASSRSAAASARCSALR